MPKPLKPGQVRRGRPKGSRNHTTTDVKEMILDALACVGGPDYLMEQARTNPNAFMALVGKVLPLTVSGDRDNPLRQILEVKRVIVGP